MKRIAIAVCAVAVLLPLAAHAGDWSAEQKEIWAWEQSCWQTNDVDTLMACFHEDFVGWGNTELGVPTNYNDRKAMFGQEFAAQETLSVYAKPLSIKIRGNVAAVLYVVTITRKDKGTGKETTSVERWTDIAMKENGKWSWIADHGSPVDSD